ncbi:MAG TPA: amino acid permease [Gemmatimonadaceae bacterium]|nr:amino acid permease [Gemmatimonadaceae bacterium]
MPDRLPRQLGVVSTAGVLVGITIGSGIFRVPSTVAADLGSVGGIAAVWLAGALITLAGALTMVGLTTALPFAGGSYVFIREAYGPLVAFLYGWIKLIVTGPAALAAVALIFAEYGRAFITLSDPQVHLLAAVLLAALTAANIRSVKWSAGLQNVSTITKVIALAALSLVILHWGDRANGALSAPVGPGTISFRGFWPALIVVLWTYTGWVDLTFIAGEVRDPTRTFPRAVASGMAVILMVYLLANAAYLYVLSVPEMARSPLVAATAAERAIGPHGAALVAALVMISTFSSLNGSILTSPRVFFAMAEDRLFFRSVATVHPKYRTPFVALLLYMVLGLIGVTTRSFEQLAEMYVLGIWPFYALAVGAVFLVPRRRPDLASLCRAWGYPVLPAAFILVSIAMVAGGAVTRPLETGVGVAIILLGVPVYYAWRALGKRRAAAERAASHSVTR